MRNPLISPRWTGKTALFLVVLDVGVVLRHGDEGQVRGAVRKVFEYFAEEVRAQTSIRDYLEGEKAVQTLHLVYMNLTNYFVIYPEQELNKGYGGLWMSPNFLNHTEMQYSYVVEFKYVKHDAGEGEVAAKLEEAREQLRQYAGDGKHAQAKGHTTLRYIAVVYRAWELAALEEVVV